jgi:hypothetical protein
VLNKLSTTPWRVCVSGYIEPYFLSVGANLRWVFSFTYSSLYPQGKTPRCPLNRRLGGPQYRSGRRAEERILDPTGAQTPIPLLSIPYPVAVPATLFLLMGVTHRNKRNIKIVLQFILFACHISLICKCYERNTRFRLSHHTPILFTECKEHIKSKCALNSGYVRSLSFQCSKEFWTL